MESIVTPGGHEIDFDRILVEDLKQLGHEVNFFVPEGTKLKCNHNAPLYYLPGSGVSYEGLKGIKKLLASVKREFNRQRWFNRMYELAKEDIFDAIIIPTSTYRYLRALSINKLKKSPVPVIFIVHGVNPREERRFFNAVNQLHGADNIRVAVISLQDSVFGHKVKNVHCIKPPTYIPRDILYNAAIKKSGILRLGFFGQYRREKNLDGLLDIFLSCKFDYAVEMFVQGATLHPDDAADFERIIQKYKHHSHIRFLHKGLYGAEWQEAIASVDVLLMPYASNRYLYHWAGMLFTAIGYQKPVIASKEINPEVFENYMIGATFNSENLNDLKTVLEQFVNNYYSQTEIYEQELSRAANDFSPQMFAASLVKLAKGDV
ncbi:MAG: glycosyltransferase family 1 protein [Negativicutes bacterium]